MEGLALPLSMAMPCTLPLPLVELLLRVVIVVLEVMATLRTTILNNGNIIGQLVHLPLFNLNYMAHLNS
jgi:hypothetical protein